MRIARPFTLLAWLFLTAGIVLGAWWAYMELGWGGYWAWDPVENASLIPWLTGTAAIHVAILDERRGKLARVNVALMSLTTVSAFFATYLVRSGVIDSVHAFGDGGVGAPLLVFILASTTVCIWAACLGTASTKGLSGIDSREGLLALAVWVFLALSVIIWIATLWPLISKLWGPQAQGLGADFYNRVCLPLFAMLTAILAMCPWMRWDGGLRNRMNAFVVIGCAVGAGMALWYAGYRQPTAFISAAAAFACLVGIGLLMAEHPARDSLAVYGVHLGVACMVLGVAFSGPYKQEADLTLAVNETGRVGAYEVRLTEITDGEAPGYHFLQARLDVFRDGAQTGEVAPERRVYEQFGRQQFAQADTVFSLDNEVYASLLGLEPDKPGQAPRVTVKISVHPLVNWLWIGGALMCLFPFLALRRRASAAPQQERVPAADARRGASKGGGTDQLPDPEQLLADLKQNIFPPHIAELPVTARIKRAFTLYERCAATQPRGLFPALPEAVRKGFTGAKMGSLLRILYTPVLWCMFLGPLYYFPVRMWRKGLILLGCVLPLGFGISTLFTLITGMEDMPRSLAFGLSMGFGYWTGLMATYDLYRLKVKKEIFWW
jgi:cytochrome c-type biogenesis protein CcmF